MSVHEGIEAMSRGSVPAAEEPEIARWKKALSDFGYPYDLISAASAEDALASERTAGTQAGFVPVILVPGHWNSESIAPSERIRRAQEMLQEASEAAYGRQYLLAGLRDMYDDLAIDPENYDPEEFERLEPIPVASVVCDSGLQIVKRWDQVAIVRVPAASTEELPAYFDWGGWNAVPEPHEIVAVARHWREAHGAELVAMGADLLEFHVPRKPRHHSAAATLLRDHYIFCGDSLETIPAEEPERRRDYLAEAAASLLESSHWVFWWD